MIGVDRDRGIRDIHHRHGDGLLIELIHPKLLAYLDVLDHTWSPDKETPITFVVIPEFVPRHWWERLLYNQSTAELRRALLGRPDTVVTTVPYRREEPATFRRRGGRDVEDG